MAKASAQTRVTVQPEDTCQIQCTKTKIVKIVLGLIVAGVLVTLVVAFVAPDRSQQHDSEFKENSSEEQKLYEPIETEMPQPLTIGTESRKSPVIFTTTTTTSATTRTFPVEEKLHVRQTMLAKPIETEMPQPLPIGAEARTSPVTPTTTTTSATTRTSPVEEKLYELQTMLAKPIQTEMPQPPPIGAKASKSQVALTTTTTSATTRTSPDTRLRSCAAIYASNPSAYSGVYTIYTEGRVPGRKVWCDMVTDGGGWTRFQFRYNGSLEFNKTWTEYRRGFGLAHDECWLGNDDLHRLTAAQPSELRVDLLDWDGRHGYAKYSTFHVGNASTNYGLHISGYKGTIGDSLKRRHNSRPFTTKDRDNDEHSSRNCATRFGGGGGWWYGECDSANLNGRYFSGGVTEETGIEWVTWLGHSLDYSYKATAMMVRPQN